MPRPHPSPDRPPRPSRFNDGYCESPYCWTREGVYYDHTARKHLCHAHWASHAGSPSVVVPQVAAPPVLLHVDRYTSAVVRLHR